MASPRGRNIRQRNGTPRIGAFRNIEKESTQMTIGEIVGPCILYFMQSLVHDRILLIEQGREGLIENAQS